MKQAIAYCNSSMKSEIFIQPANTIKTDRFQTTTFARCRCSGQCDSGLGCKGIHAVDAGFHSSISIDSARQYLERLDLQYIVDTMCASDYPLARWTVADATQGVKLYKNFLLLQKKHPHQELVPTKEIDECWHNHILFTERYFQDCSHIFGYYLHHNPASASASAEDAKEMLANYVVTKQLYLKEFHQPLEWQ